MEKFDNQLDNISDYKKQTILEELKCIFITSNEESANRMFHYLKGDLLIAETEKDNFIGYEKIYVPKHTYEWALKKGRNYAYSEGLKVDWANYNSEMRPLLAVDIGYGVLPETLLPREDEKKYSGRNGWRYDEFTPPYLLEYFKAMQRFFNNDKIERSYCDSHFMRITAQGLNYDEKIRLLQEFIQTYGYGPFEEIYPISYIGEKMEKPFSKVKK